MEKFLYFFFMLSFTACTSNKQLVSNPVEPVEAVSVKVEGPSQEAKAAHTKGMEAREAYQYEEALKHFTAAIAAYPKYPEAYYYRGQSFVGLDDKEKGLEDFQRAVEADPTYFKAYNQLIAHFQYRKRYKELLPYLDMMQQHLPAQEGAAYYKRAACYEGLNQTSLAVEQYKLALAFYENSQDPGFAEPIKVCKEKITALQE